MILDRFKITCTKYVWPANTELSKINIFSDTSPIPGLTETIDIKPYLVDISDITWDLDSTDEEDGKSNLFFEESDVTYTLSGLVNNAYLIEFFGLYRDTTTEKYLIQIEDERAGDMIHRGIVSQELIEVTFSPKKDSELLKVTAMGYLKEFKAYYSTVPMLHSDPTPFNEPVLNWTRQQNLPNVEFNSLEPTHYTWGCSMQSLLEQTFSDRTGINFILEPDVAEWYIIKNPCLSKRQNFSGQDNTCWVKSSYERIKASQENRFGFILKLCNAMGWIFYFSDNNFYIKNRSPINISQTLDFNNVIEYTLTKQKEVAKYENIIIPNGTLSVGLPIHTGGWGHVEGGRCILFSSLPTNIKERWWNTIPENWDLLTYLITIHSSFQKFHSENSIDFSWCFVVPSPGEWKINNIFTVKQSILLRIDGGDTKTSAWSIDTAKDNFGKTREREFSYEPGDDEIQWTGNFGSAMFKIDANNQVYTYENYKEAANFRNNFAKFLTNNLAKRIKLTFNSIISNPLQKYKFINDNNRFLGEWVTTSLKLDLKNEVSILELQIKED